MPRARRKVPRERLQNDPGGPSCPGKDIAMKQAGKPQKAIVALHPQPPGLQNREQGRMQRCVLHSAVCHLVPLLLTELGESGTDATVWLEARQGRVVNVWYRSGNGEPRQIFQGLAIKGRQWNARSRRLRAYAGELGKTKPFQRLVDQITRKESWMWK